MISCSNQNKIVSNQTFSNTISSKERAQPDTLAFVISPGNNIIFQTILNNSDTLDLFLDTGGTEVVLKHTTVKEKTKLLHGQNEDYEEINYDPLEGYHSLSVGNLQLDSLTIYPTALLPADTDGHFGWNIFEKKIVELDYDKNLLIVHSSYDGNLEDYSKMEIEYINTLFCLECDMHVKGKKYVNRYLFDTGFQSAIVLDKELNKEAHFPNDLPVIKESKLRNSAGTEFINKIVEVDNICFQDNCASQVPVHLLATPNPARFKTHILGNELLKRFNTVLDFQNGFAYLKPNSLMNLPYKDAS